MTDLPPAHAVFLKLAGRPVVVIGGGPVAERKVRALLESKASVTVVSPDVTPGLRDLAGAGGVRWEPRPYRPGDLDGARLVYAATDEPAVNAAVRVDANRAGIWVNVADEPEACDFLAPAVVRRGDLTIAVSTNGASPALARRIREQLEAEFGPEYAEALRELRARREAAKAAGRPLADEREAFEEIVRRRIVSQALRTERD